MVISPNHFSDSEGNRLIILGLTGISLNYNSQDYFLDSEILAKDDFNIVVFKNRIRFLDKTKATDISDSMKEKIVSTAIHILETNHLKVLVL